MNELLDELLIRKIYQPFLISFLLSFSFILIIRIFLIKRLIFKCLYYGFFLLFTFIGSTGVFGILDEYYERLDKFILLEKNNQLEYAKKNLNDYDDGMFRIDLGQFNNSMEFRNYVEQFDRNLKTGGYMSIGGFFAIICDIFVTVIIWVSRIFFKKRNFQIT
jgi:hypothetical protein